MTRCSSGVSDGIRLSLLKCYVVSAWVVGKFENANPDDTRILNSAGRAVRPFPSVPERGAASARRMAASDSAGDVNPRAADERKPRYCVVDGVVIPPGPYHWTRWRLEAGTANKRKLSTQATSRFGTF